MKVAMIGSRGLDVDVSQYVPKEITVMISGGAKGIDSLCEAYAKEHNIPIVMIKPEYQKYQKAAPLMRNKEIVAKADLVVAIWDGKSRGTKFTIDYANKVGTPMEVYVIDGR